MGITFWILVGIHILSVSFALIIVSRYKKSSEHYLLPESRRTKLFGIFRFQTVVYMYGIVLFLLVIASTFFYFFVPSTSNTLSPTVEEFTDF